MGAERRGPVVLGAIALLLAALTATTSGGLRWGIGSPHSSDHSSVSTTPGHAGGLAQQSGGGGPGQLGKNPTPHDHSWVAPLARLVLFVVLVAVVLVVAASVRLDFRRRRISANRRLPREVSDVEDEEPEEPEDLEAVLGEQLTNLDTGTPRNAIVATWVRLEEFAAGHGVPRNPAETPAEFVSRALEAYGGGGVALERLADLYREARFSAHPLGEDQRDEARRCLSELTRVVAG